MTAKHITDYLNEMQVGEKGREGTLKQLAFVIGNDIPLSANAARYLLLLFQRSLTTP